MLKDWGKSKFGGKRITVMGLGLLGRGLGDVKFLAECGADLIVTDLKSETELASSVAEIKNFTKTNNLKPITLVLGEHRLEDFRDRDLIIKAAGVPLDSIYIAEAQKHNVPVVMSTALFAKHAMANGVTIVGITGTRGKSTVTGVVFELLKNSFGNSKQIFLGGNVKDIATLPLINEVKPGDIAVLELDSWQLQGFGDERISPQFSIFTTIFPDHLNYYHGEMEKYIADKANIFLWQEPSDNLIIGDQAFPTLEKTYKGKMKGKLTVAGTSDWPTGWHAKIAGEHNHYNLTLAIALGKLMNIDSEIIKTTIENFKGVPGRLELIREISGIKIYNDTTATTPDATLAALRALSTNKNVVLIMGGADKNLDMSKLIKVLPLYCKKIILLPGTGTNRIKSQLLERIPNVVEKPSLAEAVREAMSATQSGDVVLLSPAFASFGPPPGGFKNEFDRGEQFNQIVKGL